MQVQQKPVNDWDGSDEPINRKITVQAGPGANTELNYHVPIIGTATDDCSFLIQCHLLDPTSRLLQKEYRCIIKNDV